MKKILVLVMTATMLLALASVAFAAAPEGQIAWYDFTEGEEGLTLTGEDATYADGAVTLGVDTWITADVNFTGATAITVAMKVKSDMNTDWAWDISSDEAHDWNNGEHYLGCLLNGSGIVLERYSNAGGRPATVPAIPLAADTWVELVVVYNADGSTVAYVNGEKAGEVAQSEGFDLSVANCIGEAPRFQIGKSNWPDAVNGGLTVDTLAVYNKALTANEVATAFEKSEAPVVVAPQTGVATVALAVVAMLSGAYIVTKKH